MSHDITLESLYKKSHNVAMSQLIDDIYKSISYNIVAANTGGKSELLFDLPDTFEVGNIEQKDAQIIIYSTLIERIEKDGRGPKVALVRKPDGTSMFKINWPHTLDPREIDRRKQIIMRHLTK